MDRPVDTRGKIVGAREAANIAARGATVVSGYFDPLIAWHARWLAGFKKPGRPMLVLIGTPENPILPAAARAELAASLRVVDHVAEFSAELSNELAGIPGETLEAGGGVIRIEIIRLENQDRELFRDLLELVHSRQHGTLTEQPATEQPATEQPTTEQPTTEQATAQGPTPETARGPEKGAASRAPDRP
jgi:hypothetical protein